MPQVSRNASVAQSIYRFWSNSNVSIESILNSHIANTVGQAQRCEDVLAIQDTTDLNFTSHPATGGLGYLNQTKQQGIKLHNCFAVSGAGEPLGLLDQQGWVRPEPPVPKKSPQKQQNRARPIEEKESNRWLTTQRKVEAAVGEAVHLIHVADREADIFELFAQPRQGHSDLLIRAKVNRRIKHELGKLFPSLSASPVMGHFTVEVHRRPNRAARSAQVSVRAMQARIEVPIDLAKQKPHLTPITLNAILVEETSKPEDGGKPICWRLLTSLPIDSFEQARRCVRYYSYRWLIERFHYVLKSGCKIEALQL